MESPDAVWMPAWLPGRPLSENGPDPRNVPGGIPPSKNSINNPIQKTIPAATRPNRSRDGSPGAFGRQPSAHDAQINDVRADKVTAVKSQIESGAYDTDGKKLDAAIEKMLDEVLK